MKRINVGRVHLWGVTVIALTGVPSSGSVVNDARSASGNTGIVRMASVVPPVVHPPLPHPSAGITAFINVNVLPMDTSRVLKNHTVVIEGGRITALGPGDKVVVPAGAVRVDGQGKYLMPGLADMHVHLTRDARRFDRRMTSYLASGITTVRNMDHVDANSDTTLWLRAKVAAGEILGPRIYTSGNLGLYQRPLSEIGSRVARYKAKGYDFVKVYSWDTAAIFDSIVMAARREGIPIAGHVPGGVSVRKAITGGLRSIEHNLGYYRSPALEALEPANEPNVETEAGILGLATATRQAGAWNCPTGFNSYLPRLRAVQALHAAGAGLLLGTDSPEPKLVPTLLAGFVEAGLTPYQALLTTTRNVAEFFGTLDSAGTIAVGKRADLILLVGNPLDDVWHTFYPAGVMAAGRWLPREELDRLSAAAEGGDLPNPYMHYWRSLAANIYLILKRAGLDSKIRKHGENERIRVADSLSSDARSKAGHQRLFELIAQHLGEIRATLAPQDQNAYDLQVRQWIAQRERDGYRVEVPGVPR